MSEVKKVAATDVEVNRRRGGEIRVLLSPKTVRSTSGFGGTLTMAPGDYVSEHYHPYSEEFLYVVRGELVVTVDGDTEVTLAAGEATMVPKNIRHRVENRGTEEAFCVLHLSPLAPRPELGHVDTEALPHAAEAQPAVGSRP